MIGGKWYLAHVGDGIVRSEATPREGGIARGGRRTVDGAVAPRFQDAIGIAPVAPHVVAIIAFFGTLQNAIPTGLTLASWAASVTRVSVPVITALKSDERCVSPTTPHVVVGVGVGCPDPGRKG